MRSTARFVPTALLAFFAGVARAQAPETAAGPAAAPVAVDPAPRTDGHDPNATPVYTPPTAPAFSSAPSAPPPPVLVAPPAAPEAPEPGHRPREARYSDANFDRVIVMPTAETHPEGTAYFSSYDIVLLQAGYAISDRTQVTLTGTPPFGEDLIFFLDASLKTVIAREPRFRLAALGSISGIAGLNDESFFLGRIGAVATFCLEDLCRSSVNMGTTALLAGPATTTATGVGVIWRATYALSFLFEANVLLPLGRESGRFNGLAMGPGIRLGWESFAFDVAVEWAADAEVDGNEAPPALPLLAFTYRVIP
jgi:hypothetical protein